MQRILVFIDDLTSGGAQRQIVGLAKLLHDKGYEVKLIYYHPIEFYKPFLVENGVPHECVQGASDARKRIFKIAKAIRAFHPGVVISYLDVPNIITCFLKACGIKYKLIVSERNTTQSLTNRERLKFFLMKWADAIVPNSYSQEEFITANYPSLTKKVTTITNFVDTNKFIPIEYNKNDIARLIIVGRVAKQKNTLRFLEVLNNLRKKGFKCIVDWYGYADESYNSLCKEVIAKYNLRGVIRFNKPTSNILDEYQTCDALCLPSVYEGFPNVVCEAMCCGKPILCSRICDNPTIVEDGKNGFLFDPLSIDDMTEKIANFLSLTAVEKILMGQRSRELALEKFSSETFIHKYIELIEK